MSASNRAFARVFPEYRSVERLVTGRQVTDGAGVRITRIVTHDLQRRLDPFLMLDIFRTDDPDDYIAGFPDHPHRGFETVTYMIDGRMRHRDNAGHEGLLDSGGMQWMVAGRGIVHSEMPEQTEGRMEGFQLWLNLPAADKMTAPWYRDIAAAQIPLRRLADGSEVRVIAGHFDDVAGAIQRPVTEPLYLDIRLTAGGRIDVPVPAGHNAFAVPYRGELAMGPARVGVGQLAILANDGDLVSLAADGPARAVLVAGRPLGEPIAQYGPFVMNTEAELKTAVRDFQEGRFV